MKLSQNNFIYSYFVCSFRYNSNGGKDYYNDIFRFNAQVLTIEVLDQIKQLIAKENDFSLSSKPLFITCLQLVGTEEQVVVESDQTKHE